MTGETTILLVEDDPAVALTLRDILQAEGYAVHHAKDGAMLRSMLAEVSPDLILLDLMLPDADGLVLCADLKTRVDAPVIVCSATNRKRDSVLAFKLGADDYIAKPFDVDHLLSRIEAVLRRYVRRSDAAAAAPDDAPQPAPAAAAGPAPFGFGAAAAATPAVQRSGALEIEHNRRRVTLAGHPVPVTPTEYRLLATFMSRPDEVLSRSDLAQVVWGYEDASIGRSIDVHVHRLRAKLSDLQARVGVPAPTVVSVRGFGYRLVDAEDAGATAA